MKMKAIFAFLLSALLILTCFVGCDKNKNYDKLDSSSVPAGNNASNGSQTNDENDVTVSGEQSSNVGDSTGESGNSETGKDKPASGNGSTSSDKNTSSKKQNATGTFPNVSLPAGSDGEEDSDLIEDGDDLIDNDEPDNTSSTTSSKKPSSSSNTSSKPASSTSSTTSSSGSTSSTPSSGTSSTPTSSNTSSSPNKGDNIQIGAPPGALPPV